MTICGLLLTILTGRNSHHMTAKCLVFTVDFCVLHNGEGLIWKEKAKSLSESAESYVNTSRFL